MLLITIILVSSCLILLFLSGYTPKREPITYKYMVGEKVIVHNDINAERTFFPNSLLNKKATIVSYYDLGEPWYELKFSKKCKLPDFYTAVISEKFLKKEGE